MKKKDLIQRLINENIEKNSYSLDGGLPNEMYCLGFVKNLWEVYYSERGKKTNLHRFELEEEACNYFYNTLVHALNMK
jgi:hypothetical protein